MSYYANMYFKKVESMEEALTIANNFMLEFCTEENLKTFVDDFVYDLIIKIRRENISISQSSFYKHNEFYANLWQSLLIYKFLYYPKHKLLALCTHPSTLTKKFFNCRIGFQNSTDQDYEYETWIPLGDFFKNKVEEFKTMSNKDLLKYSPYLDEDDLRDSYMDYHRKSAMYNFVWKELDLDNWLYTKQSFNNSFIPLNMCVPVIYDNYKIRDYLDKYLLECYKTFQKEHSLGRYKKKKTKKA